MIRAFKKFFILYFVFNFIPTDTVETLHPTSFNLLRVFIIPHLRQSIIIPTKVLKIVGIFMENRTDHHLNGRGIVPEYHDGPTTTIITTIGGGITLTKSTDTISYLVRLGPQVCFAPFNCFAYDGPNLTNR